METEDKRWKKNDGGIFMNKANLLEETKCELGLVLNNVEDREQIYTDTIYLLKKKIPHFKTVCIYMTNDIAFRYFMHESDDEEQFRDTVPFGEEMLSITAARSEITYDIEPKGQVIYIPFYQKHHLLGEMIIKTNKFIDDEDIHFIKDVQHMLNSASKNEK